MKTVYVIGFEAKDVEKNGVSGWEWRESEESRDKALDGYILDPQDFIIYKGEIEVKDSLTNEEITDFVEEYLYENDYENAFKNQELCSK